MILEKIGEDTRIPKLSGNPMFKATLVKSPKVLVNMTNRDKL